MEKIGRKLRASELCEHTLVAIKPPGHEVFMILWVGARQEEVIAFHANQINLTVLNKILPDGKIVDDRGREIEVFEYSTDSEPSHTSSFVTRQKE